MSVGVAGTSTKLSDHRRHRYDVMCLVKISQNHQRLKYFRTYAFIDPPTPLKRGATAVLGSPQVEQVGWARGDQAFKFSVRKSCT